MIRHQVGCLLLLFLQLFSLILIVVKFILLLLLPLQEGDVLGLMHTLGGSISLTKLLAVILELTGGEEEELGLIRDKLI